MIIITRSFQEIFFGCVSLVCVVIGVPVNLIAIITLPGTRKQNASRLLFKMFSIVDGMICLLMLPICISSFNKSAPILFSNHFFCELWSFLWGCFGRFSIFLIGMLSIMRTRSLVAPLRPASKSIMILLAAVYLALICIQGTVPQWYGVKVGYYPPYQSCVWFLGDLFSHFSPGGRYLHYIVSYLVEFVLPIFPITISCLISVYELRTSVIKGSSVLIKTDKRNATLMILALTTIYITFNIPYCIVLTLDSIHFFTNGGFQWTKNISKVNIIFLYNLIYIHTIAVNSLVNAIIYSYKMKNVQTLVNSFRNLNRKVAFITPVVTGITPVVTDVPHVVTDIAYVVTQM